MTGEEFEIIKNSIKTMTPEYYEKHILCFNGKMTKEIVETVLSKVDELKCVNSDEDSYYGIWTDSFTDLFHYIDIKYDSFKVDCIKIFEQYQTYFSYNNKKYVVSITFGQGSYIYFQKIDDFEDYPHFELEIDEEFKFYKKLTFG
jgi:hypothetical protein